MPSARRATSDLPLLTLRGLNRALLARQMLLRRERVPIATAVERLGALQAQWPPAPYIALWSRLHGFKVRTLEGALEERTVVKATVMRGTLHLMSASDYTHYAVAAPEARQRGWPTVERALVRYFGGLTPETRRFTAGWRGLGDPASLHTRLLARAKTPRTRQELIETIAAEAKMPMELAKHVIWGFIATFGGLVHVPASAAWSARASGDLVSSKAWLGHSSFPPFNEAVLHTVRRYLAAFGPATAEDVTSWTSIRTSPIREALAQLRAELREFVDDRGRILYDLTRSPRPPGDTPAPIRFLAKWDSPLLSYSPPERVRILPEAYRRTVVAKNGDVVPTVLVDGFVAARWGARVVGKRATLSIVPFQRLSAGQRADVIDEGERLVRFIHPEAPAHEVRFVSATSLPLTNLALRP